jgi:hypothetical protein
MASTAEDYKAYCPVDPVVVRDAARNEAKSLSKGDVARLKEAVSFLSDHVPRGLLAQLLRSVFKEDASAIGKSMFFEWDARAFGSIYGHEGIASPEEEWDAAEPYDRLLTAADALAELRSIAFEFGQQIIWPECKKDGRTPVPDAESNVRQLLIMLGIEVFKDDFSGRFHISGFEQWDELNDEAMESLRYRAYRAGLKSPRDFFEGAIRVIGREDRRHPVRDYFDSLEWDGTPRLDNLFIRYAGAEDGRNDAGVGEFNREAGAKLLIAAVRRVKRPGTKFDTMPVLEGPQGTEKSSFLRALAIRDDWFEETLSLGADPKGVIEKTRGKLLAEIPELSGMARRDTETVKAMLSVTVDTARLAYDRSSTMAPRQFVLVATTNSKDYLQDSTGNRRYWPIAVGQFDIQGFLEDRDQIWAEAVHREAAGESVVLSKHLWPVAARLQKDREVSEPIADLIESYVGDRCGIVSTETLLAILNFGKSDGDRISRYDPKLAAGIRRAMDKLRWERKHLRHDDGSRERVYVKKGPDGSTPRLVFNGHTGWLETDAEVADRAERIVRAPSLKSGGDVVPLRAAR